MLGPRDPAAHWSRQPARARPGACIAFRRAGTTALLRPRTCRPHARSFQSPVCACAPPDTSAAPAQPAAAREGPPGVAASRAALNQSTRQAQPPCPLAPARPAGRAPRRQRPRHALGTATGRAAASWRARPAACARLACTRAAHAAAAGAASPSSGLAAPGRVCQSRSMACAGGGREARRWAALGDRARSRTLPPQRRRAARPAGDWRAGLRGGPLQERRWQAP